MLMLEMLEQTLKLFPLCVFVFALPICFAISEKSKKNLRGYLRTTLPLSINFCRKTRAFYKHLIREKKSCSEFSDFSFLHIEQKRKVGIENV